MTNNAAIVSVVQKLTEKNGAPCKKTLQKIIFLIEAKGTPLGCDYGIHFYGPYSADLDFAVRDMSSEGILHIEYTPTEHKISVLDAASINDFDDSTVNEIIDTFGSESPNELELIATALFVYQETKNPGNIRDGVIKIKGNKYSESRIESAIGKLDRAGFFAA